MGKITSEQIFKMQTGLYVKFDHYDEVDIWHWFESIIVDDFGMISWEDTVPDVLAIAMEREYTPSEWQVMSDMFEAFVGISLEKAIGNLLEDDDYSEDSEEDD